MFWRGDLWMQDSQEMLAVLYVRGGLPLPVLFCHRIEEITNV